MANQKSIRYYRRLADLTQEELAAKVGIHPVTLSKYETGVHQPSVLTLRRIAEALGVDSSEIELVQPEGVA